MIDWLMLVWKLIEFNMLFVIGYVVTFLIVVVGYLILSVLGLVATEKSSNVQIGTMFGLQIGGFIIGLIAKIIFIVGMIATNCWILYTFFVLEQIPSLTIWFLTL